MGLLLLLLLLLLELLQGILKGCLIVVDHGVGEIIKCFYARFSRFNRWNTFLTGYFLGALWDLIASYTLRRGCFRFRKRRIRKQ